MDEKRMQEMVDEAIAKFREELTATLEKQRSEQATTALTFDTGPLKAELDAFGTALRGEFKATVEEAEYVTEMHRSHVSLEYELDTWATNGEGPEAKQEYASDRYWEYTKIFTAWLFAHPHWIEVSRNRG